MRRIMGHYNPMWFAIIGIIVSILNAALSPLFGYIFAQTLFVMMMPIEYVGLAHYDE